MKSSIKPHISTSSAFTFPLHQRTPLSAGLDLQAVFIPHPDQLCPNSCSPSAAEIQIFTMTSVLEGRFGDRDHTMHQAETKRRLEDGRSFDSIKTVTFWRGKKSFKEAVLK